jgi:hypothetical protein
MRFRCVFDDGIVVDENNKNDQQYLAYYSWVRSVASIGIEGTFIGVKVMDALSQVLRVEVPYKAYRFETPPISSTTGQTTPFEFVVVEDLQLAKSASYADPNPFLKHLQDCNMDRSQPGCAFENLHHDATLVIPRDMGRKNHHKHSFYNHLAGFMNNAPEEQMLGMWKVVAQEMTKSLSLTADNAGEPVWLSTAGTGVAWLHFRLDRRPKYYTYEPFKKYNP